jgi:hypothetical protein
MPYSRAPSAKIIANRAKKVVLNRAALNDVMLGAADGLAIVGQRILDDAIANAPRDPERAAERGVPMLADTGVLGVWALGKKVAGNTQGKPRGLATPLNQVVLFVGFSSRLGHLNELGTIHQIARPFLTPAVNRNVAGASEAVIAPAVARRVKPGMS